MRAYSYEARGDWKNMEEVLGDVKTAQSTANNMISISILATNIRTQTSSYWSRIPSSVLATNGNRYERIPRDIPGITAGCTRVVEYITVGLSTARRIHMTVEEVRERRAVFCCWTEIEK